MFHVLHHRTASGRPAMLGVLLCIPVLLSGGLPGAQASPLALISDNGTKHVALFDADLDTITASRAAISGHAVGDCALTADERTGFSSGSASEITVLEIDGEAHDFGGRAQQVPISNLGVDMALNPQETFLVLAGGGALQQPLSVIDTGLRAEVATAGPFQDHTSVEFCDDGTLLITTTSGKYYGQAPDNALYDAGLDDAGNISLHGNRLATDARPNNSACAPGSLAGVLLDRHGGLTSFTLPGLAVADRARTRNSAPAIAAAFSRDGQRLYVRTTGSVEAFDFNPATGAMTADWVREAPVSLAYYGMEQIGLHPDGGKLYVDGDASVLVLDPFTGRAAGAIPLGDATGICFANASHGPLRGNLARTALREVPEGP